MILRAGYISQAVLDAVNNYQSEHVDWPLLISELSKFQVYGLKDIPGSPSASAVWCVVNDIISRGAPTLCSVRLEKLLIERTGLITDADALSGKFLMKTRLKDALSTEQYKLLFCAMLPVQNDLSLEEIVAAVNYGYSEGSAFGSEAEKLFFNGPLLKEVGLGVLQFVQSQRSLNSLPFKHADDDQFQLQRVDFALDLICSRSMRGLILEIDGPQHQGNEFLDNARDGYEKEYRWHVYRRRLIETRASAELERHSQPVEHLRNDTVFKLIRQCYDRPLDAEEEGRKYQQLVCLPLAVARLQKVLVSGVLNGTLDPGKGHWRIAVIDRDSIGNDLKVAFTDLQELYGAVAKIHGCNDPLPSIELAQYASWNEYKSSGTAAEYDLAVDFSIRLKSGQRMPQLSNSAVGRFIVVRSVWGVPTDDHRCYSMGASLTTPPAETVDRSARYEGCQYILRNVFRKEEFREKQYDVIERLLDQKSVIALMPTGAGKSLTYQLAGIVSCGAVVIVDPIRSLMKDQVDTLQLIGIDNACAINSWLQASQRRFIMSQFLSSRYKFLFISPERMFIGDFRFQLQQFANDMQQRFAFAVIDEAHCVSEWGHDFRTTYLRLGINFRKYLKPYSSDIPFAALTGTASFEVLDDVKIELDLMGQADVDVRPTEMRRHNLSYQVVAESNKLRAIPRALDNVCARESIVNFLQEEAGSGLLFAPHIDGNNGVKRALAAIGEIPDVPKNKLDLFYGRADDTASEDKHSLTMIENQTKFKSGAIRLMCCTKAFGMGIDKPDVRFTLHTNIPPSLESFYQEAGRAGRDGKPATCLILWAKGSDQKVCSSFIESSFRSKGFDHSKIVEILEHNHHYNDFLKVLEYGVFDEFGVSIRLNRWKWDHQGGGTLYRIYINTDEEDAYKKTFIDLNRDELRIEGRVDELKMASYLTTEIEQYANGARGRILYELLGEVYTDRIVEKPLNAVLESLIEGEVGAIEIAFNNGHLRRLSNELGLDYAELQKKYSFSPTPREFIDYVVEYCSKDGNQCDESKIYDVYVKHRNDADTFKAVYRLTILGIIQDYEIDYGSKLIRAQVVLVSDDELRERVLGYIRRYAPLSSGDYEAKLPQKCTIKDAAHLLIDFVYDRIKTQRIRALEIMDQTAEKGISDPTAFGDAIVQYFDSSMLPELRKITAQYSLDDILSLIKSTENSSAKASHLLGACNRLIPEVPDNAAFHLLRAYALDVLGYTEEVVEAEVREAHRLFVNQGYVLPDLHALYREIRTLLSATQSRFCSVYDRLVLAYHYEKIRELEWLAS